MPSSLCDSGYDPNRELIVSTEFFDSFLESVKRSHRLCSLDETLDHLRSGSKEKIAHITFDDGYKDNLEYALPILEKHGAPATIYVTTRLVDGDAWMWWHELWDIISNVASISYVIDDKTFFFRCHSALEKKNVFKGLRREFANMDIETQKLVLHSMTGTDKRVSYGDLCLNWQEIEVMGKAPLITIGSHTHSHPNLSVQSLLSVEYELAYSKSLLEGKLGKTIVHLAYPFGGNGQYGTREASIAKNLGYLSAATTTCRRWRNSGLFDLPRYIVTEASSPRILRTRMSGLCNLLGNQML